MTERRYPVIIEQTGTGYSAYSPDVSGCAAVGDTKEETRRNFQDALSAHLEVMRVVGEPRPEPNVRSISLKLRHSPICVLPHNYGMCSISCN